MRDELACFGGVGSLDQSSHAVRRISITPKNAAEGLRMAELSRRALLASDPSNTGSGSSLDLPGVDAALLNPLASLPAHVTLRAAMQSFPPAVHKLDKSGLAD